MSRRAGPERIYVARRVATCRQLVDVYRLTEHDAEHWIAQWEQEADLRAIGRFSPEFWQEGGAWIMEQRRRH